jgi:glycosyltransferase involved in cell wall biosynthesis
MPDPIRLALVITALEPGGAERCLVNLAIGLDRERFAPEVYSLRHRPLAGNDLLVKQLEAANVPVHFLDIRSAWQFYGAKNRLARRLKAQRPQIVQTFLYHANVVGAQAAWWAGVPHVVGGIRVADPRRWRSWLERLATPDIDRIVCVSQSVADFCQSRGFPAEKLMVIPNGIDIDRWRDAQPASLQAFGLPSGRRAIVYVGRLDRQKGLDDLLLAMSVALPHLSEHDLLLVGEGNERKRLESIASRPALQGRVHFAGWQTDVPGILAAADLLVLPSRWEGMPNVVLEAMAAGKPVAATRAEGVSELLGDLAAGQTVAVGDWQGLANVVVAILRKPLLASELGIKNQRRAESHFSLESMIGQYERLYLESAARDGTVDSLREDQ